MADAALAFVARPAFAGLPPASPAAGAGVVAAERLGLQVVHLAALKGGREAMAATLAGRFGLALPGGPTRIAAGATAILGLGPRTWLAAREGGAPLAAELAQALGPAAAVTDQSGGYAVLRLWGPKVRALFEKGVPVDLDESAFPVGAAASTVCSHIGIVLWRLEDDAGAAMFEVALARSLAGSFWSWLAAGAGEYGLAGAG